MAEIWRHTVASGDSKGTTVVVSDEAVIWNESNGVTRLPISQLASAEISVSVGFLFGKNQYIVRLRRHNGTSEGTWFHDKAKANEMLAAVQRAMGL